MWFVLIFIYVDKNGIDLFMSIKISLVIFVLYENLEFYGEFSHRHGDEHQPKVNIIGPLPSI